MIQSKDSLHQVISRVDTLYIDRIDPIYHESYIKLLEKSNEQLSLIGNPLAWMIGALGVLFTVGAIVTAYLLWRQSKDFRDEQNSLLNDLASIRDKYKLDLDNLVNAHQKQLDATNTLLKTLEDDGKVAKEDLQKLRRSINRSSNAIKKASKDIPLYITSMRRGKATCSSCRKQFEVSFTLGENFKKGEIETFQRACPNCGKLRSITVEH